MIVSYLGRSGNIGDIVLDLDELQDKGIMIVEGVSSVEELVDLAESLGNILLHPNGERVAKLKANCGSNSLHGTFSKNYGFEAFPFHTDTAFWGLPVRFVVMGMFGSSKSTTNYVTFNDIQKVVSFNFFEMANRSIYLIETFEGAKYTSPVFHSDENYGYRFDPNIMSPVNRDAKIFHEEMLLAIDKIEPRKVSWSGNKAVILDNWQYLHNRSAVNEESREILRLYIE